MPSHGSLAKAGKVRDRNPVHWEFRERKSKRGTPLQHVKAHKPPRIANRRKFERRIKLKQRSGQRWLKRRR